MKFNRICLLMVGIGTALAAWGQGRGGGQAVDPWPGMKKLLAVADVQTGYHHDSISHALATVERIGRDWRTYVTMIRTDSQLITHSQIKGQGRYDGRDVNAKTLNFYDALFMLPSGYGTLTEDQKAELLSFVRDDGKGLIVGHATEIQSSQEPTRSVCRLLCSMTSIRFSRRLIRVKRSTSSCASIQINSTR